jgi:two-component system, LytTR family, sensor kinase
MQHPVLKNSRSLVIYFSIWTVIALADFFSIYSKFNFGVAESLTGSFISNSLFSLFGIAIWYAVLYSFPEKIGPLNLIINHITAATVLVVIWNVTTIFLFRVLINEQFYNFILDHIKWHIAIGFLYYFILVLIYYIIIYNVNLKEKRKNEDRLMAIINETELNLLKSQINPHFLFNSLNSISSLTITNPSKAQEMIIKLSDFLRYSISRGSNQKSNLKLELDNIQRYLDIEKTRFGEKLNYKSEIEPECFEKLLPVMILQPLYENAVKHGVYESTEPITLKFKAYMENNFLVLLLSNNYDVESPSKKGSGIGLKNIKERLRIIYKRDGLLQTQQTTNNFEVKLVIPQDEK